MHTVKTALHSFVQACEAHFKVIDSDISTKERWVYKYIICDKITKAEKNVWW